jgi:hypothetical protein
MIINEVESNSAKYALAELNWGDSLEVIRPK